MKTTEKIILAIVLGYCLLHISILFQIVPIKIVWGGKIKSINTLYILESIALLIMSFLGLIILMKNRLVKPIFTDKTIKKILFVFAIFFMLNTLGNLMAETILEKCQSIITLFLAITLFKSSRKTKSI